jgi:hypothetical protein
MTEEKRIQILEETGGDCYFANLFIGAAASAAASMGVVIEAKLLDFFYREVERHRKAREKRISE